MADSRINRLTVGIVLLALAASFLAGSAATADQNTLARECHCVCTSPANCAGAGPHAASACANMPADSKCKCSISSAPDNEKTPAVVPVMSRQMGIDGAVAALTAQDKPASGPQLTWAFMPEQVIYDFLYSAPADGRAPPFATHIISCS